MEIYKKCKIKNCRNNAFWKSNGTKGYCCKHFTQINRHGKILERTRYNSNEIINCGEYYEIILYSGLGEQKEVARTLIDKEDLDKIKNYKWGLNNKGYALTRINKKTILFLHNLIFGFPPVGYEVDHRDTDPLNNRKYNLRFATHQQNNMNKKVKGYCWDKKQNRWFARIKVNGKNITLGRFIDERDAIKARREAELKYFGEYAYNINI